MSLARPPFMAPETWAGFGDDERAAYYATRLTETDRQLLQQERNGKTMDLKKAATDRAWWIWLRDKPSGNERWAKSDSHDRPLTLGEAVAVCADWNTRAERHEYSVRPFTPTNGGELRPIGVRIMVPSAPRDASTE